MHDFKKLKVCSKKNFTLHSVICIIVSFKNNIYVLVSDLKKVQCHHPTNLIQFFIRLFQVLSRAVVTILFKSDSFGWYMSYRRKDH